MLQENSERTAKEMAAELSLTTTPVYERIKKLEKAGYIKKYVALLDTDIFKRWHRNGGAGSWLRGK